MLINHLCIIGQNRRWLYDRSRGLTHRMKESQKSKSPAGKTDTTDEYQRAVTIGERKSRNSTIHLAPYDLDWPSQFSLQAKRIHAALRVKVLLLEHVGSTSVPGLSGETSNRYGLGSDGFCRRAVLCPTTCGTRLCDEDSRGRLVRTSLAKGA